MAQQSFSAEDLRRIRIAAIPVKTAMDYQDALPVEWRELIYDFGQTRVFTLLQRGYSLKEAQTFLGAKKPGYQPGFSRPVRRCRR